MTGRRRKQEQNEGKRKGLVKFFGTKKYLVAPLVLNALVHVSLKVAARK